MKKIYIYIILVFHFIFFILSHNVAVVKVNISKTFFHYDDSSYDVLHNGNVAIIVGCNVHSWRSAYFKSSKGVINSNDIEVLWGTLPDCEYISEFKPPDILKNPHWFHL